MYKTNTPYTQQCAANALARRKRGFLNRKQERTHRAISRKGV